LGKEFDLTVSKKLTLDAAGAAVVISTPSVTDIVTTLIDPNVALTGWYKIIQDVGLVAVGHMAGNRKHTGSYLNFSGANGYF
jgi:hypothetical protein